jgi:AcrR family transcriptional regulator
MSRPRKISDEDVVEAVAAMLSREGPAGLTFASASAVTGLSPATLVQRYGNREALLRAALLWMWDQLDLTMAGADATHPVDAEGAIALLVRLSAGYGAGDDAAQGLLLLREDFRDPLLRARGVAWNQALTQALGRRLSDDPEQQVLLGRLMASQWQGAVLWWGFSRQGTLRSVLRRELREWLTALGR